MGDSGYFGTGQKPLAAPADCPVDHGFSPFSDGYVADPWCLFGAQCYWPIWSNTRN